MRTVQMPDDPALIADCVAPRTHAEKVQRLQKLLEKSKADHERTKATLAWFTAWVAGRYGGGA